MGRTYNFNLKVSDAETNEKLFEVESDSFYDIQKQIIDQYFSGNNCEIENRITDSNFSIQH